MSDTPPIPSKPKRPNRQVQKRCALTARDLEAIELAAQGLNQQQIGDKVGLTRSGVSKLMHRVEKRLHEMLKDRADEIKARQTLYLETLYREAMTAWQSSKADAEGQKVTTSDKGTTTESTRRNQHGDPRFLDQARGALSDIRRIWGLDTVQPSQGAGASVKIQIVADSNFFGRARDAVDARVIDVPDNTHEVGPALIEPPANAIIENTVNDEIDDTRPGQAADTPS